MERLVETEAHRLLLMRFIANYALPFVVVLKDGRGRSYDQNKLQFLWAAEAAAHRQDMTAREVQLEWKVLFAAPILMQEDGKFADLWSWADCHLTYDKKLELMDYIPVTSLLSMKGFARYLDDILRYHAEQGIQLTVPEDLRWGDAVTANTPDRKTTKRKMS